MPSYKDLSTEIDISDSSTTSDVLTIPEDYDFLTLEMPVLTSTTITLQTASAVSATYKTIQVTDGSDDWQVTGTIGSIAVPLPREFAGIKFLKIISSANQTADRTFKVLAKRTY